MRALRFGARRPRSRSSRRRSRVALVFTSNHDTRPWLTAGLRDHRRAHVRRSQGSSRSGAGPRTPRAAARRHGLPLVHRGALTESEQLVGLDDRVRLLQPRLRRLRRADPRLSRRDADPPRRWLVAVGGARRDRSATSSWRWSTRRPPTGCDTLPAERDRRRRLADERAEAVTLVAIDHRRRRPRADRGDPRRPLAAARRREPPHAPRPSTSPAGSPSRCCSSPSLSDQLVEQPYSVVWVLFLVSFAARAAVVPRRRAPQPLRPRRRGADPALARRGRPAPRRGRRGAARPVARDRLPARRPRGLGRRGRPRRRRSPRRRPSAP